MNENLLKYFNGDELAATTWKKKYAQPSEETPEDMHRRLAKEFARVEFAYRNKDEVKGGKNLSKYGQKLWEELGELNEKQIEDRIFGLFDRFKYLVPQGSIMSQLGAKSIGSLSNCFVIGQPYDSYGGIMKKDEEQVQLMKRRGGVGLDLSTLRPSDTPTSNAAKTSTGAVSFAPRASNSTREVAQNGRRGALMLSIDIRHPDSLSFATMKQDLTKITGANISVKLWDDFMEAVENDDDYYLTFPVDERSFHVDEEMEYDTLYESTKGAKFVKKIKAKHYWDTIVQTARDVAEPGLMFWDTMVQYSPDGVYPQYIQVTTNPCSEIAMQAYDACRLLISNLFSFVENPFTPQAKFDFDKFMEINYEAMRLMDDVVTLEIEYIDRILDKLKNDPEPMDVKRTEIELLEKVRAATKGSRRTGLGYTALADAIAALGMKYDSDEAIAFIEKLERAKMESELQCTIDLAQLRGVFEGHNIAKEYSINGDDIKGNNPFYEMLLKEFPHEVSRMIEFGRRNLSWSCLAPTGTTSMMTQSTSGVEPLFMWGFMRRRKVNPNEKGAKVAFIDDNGDAWEEFAVIHPKLKTFILINYPHVDVDNLTEAEVEKYYEKSPYFNATANDIDWIKRVEIQSVIQKYTTHSISSTINLPEDVSTEEVSRIYEEAWKQGLKGITVYRDGSRSGVLVSNDKKEETVTTFHENHAPRRPKRLQAKLVRFNNNKERWIAFVGLMDGKPYEIFTGRLEDIKIPLKVEEGEIVKVRDEDGNKRYDFEYEEGNLEGIDQIFDDGFWNYAKLVSGMLRHGMPLHFAVDMVSNMSFPEDHINTWKNGVARTLKKFIPDGKAEGLKCQEPDCLGGNVIFEEGCSRCLDCGSSKCG